MKRNYFVLIVIALCLAAAFAIFYLWFGNPDNFLDPLIKHQPKPGNLLGTVYTGGPLVAILVSLTLMVVTFIIERLLSLSKAEGRGSLPKFLKKVHDHLVAGNIDAAIDECNKQRGSAASIIRAGLEQYQMVKGNPNMDAEKKISEVKRAVDEATGLETPLLEKNLVALSTIASISTMIGLLGTTIGMIRAFQALAVSGQAASAVQLSIGISEALINTAGGLIAAVLAIVAYNYFTTRVDNFVYMVEEATLQMMEILSVKEK